MTRQPIALLILCAALAANAQQLPKKPARPAPPAPPLVLAPATSEQAAAAAMTYLGEYACEFDQKLQVSLNPRSEAYVDVRFGKQLHTMKPILSSTGALRLEDVRGRYLLVQIGVKSMLFDVKAGHRLVDECVHEKQAESRRAIAAAPPQPGLGIDPARAAEVVAGEAAKVDAARPAPTDPVDESPPCTTGHD